MAVRFGLKRPAWVVGCTLFLSLLIGSVLSWRWLTVCTVAGVFLFAVVTAVPLVRQRFAVLPVVLFAVCTALGMLMCHQLLFDFPLAALAGQKLQVTALVERLPDTTHDSFQVRVSDGLPAGTVAELWENSGEFAPACGDLIEGEMTAALPDNSLPMRADGVGLYLFAAYSAPPEVTQTAAAPWWQMAVFAVRDYVGDTVSEHLTGDSAGLVESLCIGERSGLSETAAQQFRRSGVYHVLVVSGLHLSVLTMALMGLWRLLRVRRRWRPLLTVPFVIAFMLLTGLQPSVCRAGIMTLLMLTALCIWREADSLNSLGLALLVMGILNPYAPCDVGLQLSVAATAGILVLFPPLAKARCRRFTRFGGVADFAGVTLSATLPTLPLTAVYFGQIPMLGLLASGLCIYPAEAVILFGFAGILTSLCPWLWWLTTALFWVADLMCRWLLTVTSWLGGLPFAVLPMTEPYLIVWLLAAGGLLLLGWYLWRGRGLAMAAALSVIVLCVGTGLQLLLSAGTVSAVVCQSSGTAVVLSRSGHTALLLSGDQSAWNAAVRQLERRNITQVELAVWLDEPSVKGIDFSVSPAIGTLVLPRNAEPLELLPSSSARAVLPEDGVLTFWDGCAIRRMDDFLLVTAGQTRLLICPPDGDAAYLSEAWRDTDAILFRESPPQNAELLTAAQGVFAGSIREWTAWSSVNLGFPMTAAVKGELSLSTRGGHDLTVR